MFYTNKGELCTVGPRYAGESAPAESRAAHSAQGTPTFCVSCHVTTHVWGAYLRSHGALREEAGVGNVREESRAWSVQRSLRNSVSPIDVVCENLIPHVMNAVKVGTYRPLPLALNNSRRETKRHPLYLAGCRYPFVENYRTADCIRG